MFNFLGTMRQCQWKMFRDWTLNERRGVSGRLKVLNAEINRIGCITVFYKTRGATIQTLSGALDEVETVTEERIRFEVSPGSSLEKLVQAYIAHGGNPMAISLWLQPDLIQFTTDEDPNEDASDDRNKIFSNVGSADIPFDQPDGAVRGTESVDSYGIGGQYKGGMSTSLTDTTRMAGRYIEEGTAGAKIAIKMDWARRWVRYELSTLNKMEERIVKLMDLREQLMEERDSLLCTAIGGSVPDYPLAPDPERYARNLHLTTIVTQMDQTFYETDENGEPDFTRINLGKRVDGTSLSDPTDDIQGEKAQVIPSGIAFYDTLFPDPPGTDLFCA